jgi:FlaA1/EpsC-like NDP-sugar epimerase
MTLSEASQLVIQAGAMAEGGEVFVLDMGEPVKIIDLARRMIQLSGLTVRDEKTPNGEIEIEVTGLRAGEKLVEELLIAGNSEPTLHKRILRAHEEFIPWRELQDKIRELETAIDLNDITMIETLLQQLVKGYSPSRFSI